MEATPAPKPERLARAARLIAAAAAAGARLVVLPELFSVGYDYSEINFEHPEPLEGPTVAWLRAQAAQHQVHLAGTLLLLDGDHVYNSALLIAPDGVLWRYDKQYPFAWERAFFREGHGITIAETALGKLGLLICWDAAHPAAWERYAGRVDALLILSSPPCLHQMDVCFPDGTRVPVSTADQHFADADMEAAAAWLRVPVIHASAAGAFTSILPLPRQSTAALLLPSPQHWHHLAQADEVRIEAGYRPQTRIIDATGEVLARVTQDGDSFTVAKMTPAGQPPPDGVPPLLSATPFTLFRVDVLAAALMIPVYRRGLRRQWGARMAPPDARTNRGLLLLLLIFALGWLAGLNTRRRRG
jgi:predicted amidohydrolase